MTPLTWPPVVLLLGIFACMSTLVWKGTVPSHAIVGLASLIVGYLIPRGPESLFFKRDRVRDEKFPDSESPTKNELKKSLPPKN
jgi:hypothetical protein